ncbi:unnamed protein product [marine sediment metagenome]|uniref:Uncharacterized protein n=1 Tax=marine sediment metagenome TaxID=412755 RepID=X0XDC3_9ZZZZ
MGIDLLAEYRKRIGTLTTERDIARADREALTMQLKEAQALHREALTQRDAARDIIATTDTGSTS